MLDELPLAPVREPVDVDVSVEAAVVATSCLECSPSICHHQANTYILLHCPVTEMKTAWQLNIQC